MRHCEIQPSKIQHVVWMQAMQQKCPLLFIHCAPAPVFRGLPCLLFMASFKSLLGHFFCSYAYQYYFHFQGILYKSAKKKKRMAVGFVVFESVEQVKDAIEVSPVT